MLPVTGVRIGISPAQQVHFLSIQLATPPQLDEIREVHGKLFEYFNEQEGPFFYREFVENEIQLRPTEKSAEIHFTTLAQAIEEYQHVLKVLGIETWVTHLVVDGDLRPFDES